MRPRALYIHGAIGLVPFVGHMARGQRGPGAFELVLSPLRIGFPIIITEDNPVIATLAQPTVCFDLQGRFLNTGKGVKRERNLEMWRDRTLSWRDSSCDGLPTG